MKKVKGGRTKDTKEGRNWICECAFVLCRCIDLFLDMIFSCFWVFSFVRWLAGPRAAGHTCHISTLLHTLYTTRRDRFGPGSCGALRLAAFKNLSIFIQGFFVGLGAFYRGNQARTLFFNPRQAEYSCMASTKERLRRQQQAVR